MNYGGFGPSDKPSACPALDEDLVSDTIDGIIAFILTIAAGWIYFRVIRAPRDEPAPRRRNRPREAFSDLDDIRLPRRSDLE